MSQLLVEPLQVTYPIQLNIIFVEFSIGAHISTVIISLAELLIRTLAVKLCTHTLTHRTHISIGSHISSLIISLAELQFRL